jgi:XTP/dITP diphosphohydrolase
MDRPTDLVELRVIARGAEADIVEAEWLGMRVVLKRRTVRPYLNPQLDARVRYRRTLREAAALHDAKLAGVPAPTVYFVDPMGAEIIMEMIEGRRLKELLEEERRVDLMRVVGDYLGRLHGSGIVHGDPTTSNFVLSGEVLYALDFGLSFRSRSPRDQATDLHVLKEALESYHSDLFEESMKLLIEGYAGSFGGSREALAWLRRLESSGRYRGDRALERSLCLISGNRHKLQEMSVVAEAMGWRLRPCEGRKLEVQSDDLAEIALAAARAAAIPGSIVEDSGLFVRSLGGFPGPYSSYAMSTIGYRGLLKLMEGVEDRAARFESAIAYTDQAGRIRVFTARVCGAIAEEPAGTGGFGFDPVFIPAGYSRTFAEMDLREKSWISHRGIAMSRLLRWLEAYGGARGAPRGRRPHRDAEARAAPAHKPYIRRVRSPPEVGQDPLAQEGQVALHEAAGPEVDVMDNDEPEGHRGPDSQDGARGPDAQPDRREAQGRVRDTERQEAHREVGCRCDEGGQRVPSDPRGPEQPPQEGAQDHGSPGHLPLRQEEQARARARGGQDPQAVQILQAEGNPAERLAI